MKEAACLPDDHFRDRMPLLKIAFSDGFRIASSTGKQFQFPSEIKSILHPRIHPLAAGGAMDMGGIPKEKYSPDSVPPCDSLVHREIRQPLRLRQSQVCQTRVINVRLNFVNRLHATVHELLSKTA